ncbi:FUSC family protein [Paraburkholderia flagellata]|uniref:FUSC family protein n=1 Tax=Paraburkholderia flagellata TaxID=2883241 RepID=UPI001F189321|nr:FUSC family protein [Paraburkholderia flagellata]
MASTHANKSPQWRKYFSLAPRFIDEMECVIAVLLAIGMGHYVCTSNVSWAAFSGYMVMRGHVADSFSRGFMRIVGTGCGAGLAVCLIPAVASSWLLASLAGGLIAGVSLYGAMTQRHAYAWLFVGLTFGMVMLDAMEHPSHSPVRFSTERVFEVGAGTVACMLVSAVSNWTVRRRWPAERASPTREFRWHPGAAFHAMQGATAIALLPMISHFFRVPALSQGAVSIMVVMFVPLASIARCGLVPVSRRLVLRLIGCVAGCALATPVLLAAHGSAIILIVGTIVGVMLGRHLENSGNAFSYAGTQFTLAILVILVPDNYAHAELTPILTRLAGIVLGFVLLEVVLVIWCLFEWLLKPDKKISWIFDDR